MKKITLAFLLQLGFTFAKAQEKDSLYMRQNYDFAEYQIPMSDGLKLCVAVYTLKDQSKKYPILSSPRSACMVRP